MHSPSIYQRDLSSRDDFNVDRDLFSESMYHPTGPRDDAAASGGGGSDTGGAMVSSGGGSSKLSPYCCLLTLKGTMPSPLTSMDATGRAIDLRPTFARTDDEKGASDAGGDDNNDERDYEAYVRAWICY